MSKKQARSVVLSVRLDETTLAAVDLLVEAGLAQSRSEAASQFIALGVQSSEELIVKARSLAEHVRRLKHEMLDAVRSQNLDKVKQLLELDEQLKNAATGEGHTAILMSAYYRANEIKELLLQKGAALNLYEAAAVGHTGRVREALQAAPELIDSRSFDGYTPLGLAAHFGNEETAAYLIGAGADVNRRGADGKLNNMPLHAAIAGNHADVVRLLLQAGADVDARCEGELRPGYTPLHVAAHFGRADIAALLLGHGADPALTNADGLTPAEYAERRGYGEIVKLLASPLDSSQGG